MARKDRHLSNIVKNNKDATASRLSLEGCIRPQELEFQGCLFSEDFMREGCLQEDLLFTSVQFCEQEQEIKVLN
ncbi:hypothetical protein TNCV_4269881 [Trichonephila clavipes]|nr:hypothetical protein TNCV_4269881 [Trichonephila clavipes]